MSRARTRAGSSWRSSSCLAVAAIAAVGAAAWSRAALDETPDDAPSAGARRRLARPQWAISIAGALAVIGFVGAAQWNSSLGRQEFVTSAQRVLVTEAEQLQRQQEALRAEIELAEDRVRAFQERVGGLA